MRPCVRVCIYKTVCMQQLVPCGVMICAGLAGALTFHVVRVPSEWLQTNCFPSWCQATEWIALKTHTAAHHTHAHTHTHFSPTSVCFFLSKKKPDEWIHTKLVQIVMLQAR